MKTLFLLIALVSSNLALAWQVPETDYRDMQEQKAAQVRDIRAKIEASRKSFDGYVSANKNILAGTRLEANNECEKLNDKDLVLLCKVAILNNRTLQKADIEKIMANSQSFLGRADQLIKLVNN